MMVSFHPEFPKDIKRFRQEYLEISEGLGARFLAEIDSAVEAIKESPRSAGHLMKVGAPLSAEVRRRNLRAFPFFVLYGATNDLLIFGAVIPGRSDPLTWLKRFKNLA